MRCVSIDQIQIYACVFQKEWVTLGPLSIKSSTRGVYQLLQIQIYVSFLPNVRVPLSPIGIKAYLLLQELCNNCFQSKYMLVFYEMDG